MNRLPFAVILVAFFLLGSFAQSGGSVSSNTSSLPEVPQNASAAEKPVVQEEIGKTYARSEMDGVIIAKSGSWYLEEYDSLERPIAGTFWEKGKITRTTVWTYVDDTQCPKTKIITDEKSSTETGFDRSGNVVSVAITDAAGKNVSVLENTYDSDNRLSVSILTKDGIATRTVFLYASSGMPAEKRVYTNGKLSIVYSWRDEENWTETVYSNDKKVLVSTYENGIRQKDRHEKKQ